jgi:hypothetical protein
LVSLREAGFVPWVSLKKEGNLLGRALGRMFIPFGVP